MIRVAVSGAGGRMGRAVSAALEAAADMELVARYDPGAEGCDPDPGAVAGADVVVEFTVPDVVMANLRARRELGVHAVEGTSGFDDARMAELR